MKDKDITSNRIRCLRQAVCVEISKERTRHQPYAVIDTGAEQDIVGIDGWHILHFSD